MGAVIHSSAEVHPTTLVGDATRIWHLAQIREGVEIGKRCILGRAVYVGPRVQIGDDCKIQNGAMIFGPAVLETGVFLGPSAVLTNDRHPRAVTETFTPKGPGDWTSQTIRLRRGASVGAGAILVAPLVVGEWAAVGAGAVVTRDVADFVLVAGSPARSIGWVGRAGRRLVDCGEGILRCPATGERYVQDAGGLRLVDA